MKNKFFKAIGLAALCVLMSNCSDNDSAPTETTSQYAMTAKVNGVQYNMMSPFGTHNASSTIFGTYPNEDYVFFQGRRSIIDLFEIDIFIRRTDLIAGRTFEVNEDTEDFNTHIFVIDANNDESEITYDGQITLTEVNNNTRHVKGTFWVETSDNPWVTPIISNKHITNGTFDYFYDQED